MFTNTIMVIPSEWYKLLFYFGK